MAITNPCRGTAIFIIETFYEQLWGFKPDIIESFVKQGGPVRSLFWFIRNTLKYEGTLERWGPLRTHLLATSISAINGCPYCVYGQSFALQLHYLKQTGQLFPLTEQAIMALCGQAESQIISTLESALTAANLESETLSLQRMSELRHNPALATTNQDRRIIHLIHMFSALNTCGMRANLCTDQAHTTLNKNRTVRDRYLALRQSEQTKPVSVPPSGITVLNPADVLDPADIAAEML